MGSLGWGLLIPVCVCPSFSKALNMSTSGSPCAHLQQRWPTLLGFAVVFWLLMSRGVRAKSPAVSELRSQISGVEELLEEFRQQLLQDQEQRAVEEGLRSGDACLSRFAAMEDYIIRTRDSLSAGATFLSSQPGVADWSECLRACCGEPRCSLAVLELGKERSESESRTCFLFNCTYRGRNACKFSPQRAYSSYTLAYNGTGFHPDPETSRSRNRLESAAGKEIQEKDEPPRSDAGRDVVLQLPNDWVILDGQDSMDDHKIIRYEWTLLQGDPSVNMKAPNPGLLRLSGLQEGVYVLQLTVTDSAGQKSSDNVTVTVLQSDRSVIEDCLAPPETGPCRAYFPRWYYDISSGTCKHFVYGGCTGNRNNFLQEEDCIKECVQNQERTIGLKQDAEENPFSEISQKSLVEQQPVRSSEVEKNGLPRVQGQRKQSKEYMSECLAPPETGPCRAYFPRWYYDVSSGTCKHFVYGGCSGNRNNFLQEEDCIKECVRSQEDCLAPPEIGLCRAYFPRWYYDVSSGTCKHFIYGGCNGNRNNFLQEEDCIKECVQSQEDCLAPPEIGPCRAYFPRWYYDISSGTCKHFIYSGCNGNRNNFLQEEDCIKECVRSQGADSAKSTTALLSPVNPEPANSSPGVGQEVKEENKVLLKTDRVVGGHPFPESGAVLPLALGLAITAFLLLMVACRLRLMRQKLRKARPITSEESDYLINGMYL
ncbi:low-density lipoprotein receptor-related protein 11 [Latimeria chalumnae]|uniref:low-density lipoprotein receptor-related protein 11 n=1 Tax=Latimeria chalumnae TaxID=7897 RepID=UPI00313D16E0